MQLWAVHGFVHLCCVRSQIWLAPQSALTPHSRHCPATQAGDTFGQFALARHWTQPRFGSQKAPVWQAPQTPPPLPVDELVAAALVVAAALEVEAALVVAAALEVEAALVVEAALFVAAALLVAAAFVAPAPPLPPVPVELLPLQPSPATEQETVVARMRNQAE